MDGVVFDFDGVLCRSMEQHAKAYRRVLAGRVEVQDEQVFRLEGARSETILRDLCPDLSDVEVKTLALEKQEVFRALGDPPLYDGAQGLIEAVAGRVPVALVTGTRRENLERLIPDLLPRFAAVMSQESYARDKPHPEPYQKAAEALCIDPERLVCVENAVRGVESARAAGYGAVIAITTTMPAEALDADQVVPDHVALQDRLVALLSQD